MGSDMSASRYLPLSTQMRIEKAVHDEEPDSAEAQDELAVPDVVHADRAQADQDEPQVGGGEADEVDREAAFVGPVVVLQVQDQRELVEHE